MIHIGYPIYKMWFETNVGETGFKDLRIDTQYTQQENNLTKTTYSQFETCKILVSISTTLQDISLY